MINWKCNKTLLKKQVYRIRETFSIIFYYTLLKLIFKQIYTRHSIFEEIINKITKVLFPTLVIMEEDFNMIFNLTAKRQFLIMHPEIFLVNDGNYLNLN